MHPACADRNLLFGLLALQNGLIDQGQLVAAFQAWTLDENRPLARHLVCRGQLDDEDCHVVEALVSRHLKKHGDRVEKSLAAVSDGLSLRDTMTTSAGSPIEPTLGFLCSVLGVTANGQASRGHSPWERSYRDRKSSISHPQAPCAWRPGGRFRGRR